MVSVDALAALVSRKGLCYRLVARLRRCQNRYIRADVPRLRRLVASVSSPLPAFDPRLFYVQFLMDKVALKQGFLPVLSFFFVSICSPVLHTISFNLSLTLCNPERS